MAYTSEEFKDCWQRWRFGDDLDGDLDLVGAALQIAANATKPGLIEMAIRHPSLPGEVISYSHHIADNIRKALAEASDA